MKIDSIGIISNQDDMVALNLDKIAEKIDIGNL